MAKTNHIDSTRPAPISTNEFTTACILIGIPIHEFEIIYNSKYGNLRNKTEALVLLK